MHEFSIAEAIVRAATNVVQDHGGGKILKVQLRVGELKQVVPDALQFAFDILKHDTLLDEAVLEWETVAAQIRCKQCNTVYRPSDIFWQCPICEALGGEAVAGEELDIVAITCSEERDGD